MSEKNEIVVATNWKKDLKTEANVQCKAVANDFMQSLKVSAGDYAKYAIRRIFDELINYMNEKLFA